VGGGKVNAVGSILGELGLKRPIVVSDPFMLQSGVVGKVSKSLADHGVAHETWAESIPDPTTESVAKCMSEIEKGSHDCIIAVGGGSSMDTAKAAGVLSVHKGQMRDYKAPFQMDAPSLPIIAIPTTSGSGSECTRFTIVSDSETEEKMLCMGTAYLPTVAIIDYELTLTKPWSLSAETGLDALCHAMESYVSVKSNSFSDALALASLEKIGRALRTVCKEPSNHDARAQMSLASTEAGLSFSNSSVTLIHGMSRPLGCVFHVSHGLSNAMLLPKVTEFSINGNFSRYANVARQLGLAKAGATDEHVAKAFPGKLAELTAELKIPTLKEYGIDASDFRKAVPKMASDALASGSPNNNPIVPDQSQIQDLYEKIYDEHF